MDTGSLPLLTVHCEHFVKYLPCSCSPLAWLELEHYGVYIYKIGTKWTKKG